MPKIISEIIGYTVVVLMYGGMFVSCLYDRKWHKELNEIMERGNEKEILDAIDPFS